jgi:hypothetical protein
MKKKYPTVVAFLLLSVMLFSACSTPSTGQLSGKVFWTGDNNPAKNITVNLEPIDESLDDTNPEPYKCKIDTEGKYIFSDIKPGDYNLTIWWFDENGKPSEAENGFNVKATGITSENMSPTFIATLDEDEWACSINFEKMTINAGDVITWNIEFTGY